MTTYSKTISVNPDRKMKKEVRDFLFSFFVDMELNKIVGLAGPNIQDYVNFCKSKGFKEFEIYETDVITAIHQLTQLNTSVKLNLKNIIEADSQQNNTLYDLDYCATIRYLKEHVVKFKDKFIMTFSTRIGVQETIEKFFSFRKEKILGIKSIKGPGLQNKMFTTTAGKYLFITYRDTSAMCCIAKIA